MADIVVAAGMYPWSSLSADISVDHELKGGYVDDPQIEDIPGEYVVVNVDMLAVPGCKKGPQATIGHHGDNRAVSPKVIIQF